MPARDAIYPAKRHSLYDIHRYSAAIRSGDLLFVSGQVGSREDGSPEPVFEDQVRRAFANLREVLAAAGVDSMTLSTSPPSTLTRTNRSQRCWPSGRKRSADLPIRTGRQ